MKYSTDSLHLNLNAHRFRSLDGRHFTNDGAAARADLFAGTISGAECRDRIKASLKGSGIILNKRAMEDIEELGAVPTVNA